MHLPLLLYGKKYFLYFFLFSCLVSLFQKAFSQTITTVAGNGRNGPVVNGGLATSLSVPYPTGVCVDDAGNLYITASETVWKIEAGTGIIYSFAGKGTFGSEGDGAKATEASLKSPVAVCTDKSGNIYIAEYNGHRIRKVSPSGIITTVAGTGAAGYSGDGGPATGAKLNSPRSVTTDSEGNLFIADLHNHRVRKVAVNTGVITTVAGTGFPACSGNGGQAAMADIASPTSVFADKEGNLFFTEADLNLSCRVRKIAAGSGIITTIAGNNQTGYSGDGEHALQAGLFVPTGVAVDKKGNIFISEHNGSRIRKVEASTGIISAIAGGGTHSYCCDGGPAINAMLNNPTGLALDTAGNLFVADNNNHRIRKIEMRVSCQSPSLTITAPSTLFCYNQSLQFTATLSTGINNPVYQWKVNNAAYGDNVAAIAIVSAVGDVVSCEVTGTTACGDVVQVTSNNIIVQPNPGYHRGPEVIIEADRESICAGEGVLFAATNKSENATPVYQWLVNGAPVGTNSTTYFTTTLANNNKVECIMTVPHCGSNGGSTKDYSNAITIKVDQTPQIQFDPSNPIIDIGTQVQLRPVVQGDIVSHRWAPSSLLTDPAALSLSTLPLNSTTTYQLWVQTAAGCENTASITVRVYSKLYVPSAFTPNGDGKNDVFRIPPTATFLLEEFLIFDRWGNKVFSTTEINKGWDGKTKGINGGTDTYVYFIRGQDHKGPVFLKGALQLIR